MIWPVEEARQRSTISKMWGFFPVSQDDPLHLRAIWGKGVPNPRQPQNITFTAAAYPMVADRQQAFADMALFLNAQGYNVFTCFNIIRPQFMGDEHNGLAVKDSDILERRYLLIDVDRAQTIQPATDDEIEAVFEVAFEVEKYLVNGKRLPPITVCSGNGAHIYLPIALPNDLDSKLLCQRLLNGLAAKYDTLTAKVDVGVYNAGRIAKVPGTIARKGIEVEDDTGYNDRGYRMVAFVE